MIQVGAIRDELLVAVINISAYCVSTQYVDRYQGQFVLLSYNR